MKIHLLMLSVLSMIGCGHQPQVQIEGFENQVNAFVEAGASVGHEIKIRDLDIRFAETNDMEGKYGKCEIKWNQSPTVTIDQTRWEIFSDTAKEALIFHELGHCVLGRSDLKDLNADNMPQSIMQVSAPALFQTIQQYYVEHRQAYIEELFN
jgi:hypothetical protein